MADIFLGYGGPNRDFARWSVNWLEKCGWSVFWDGELHSGQPFDTRIENELDQAGCVVVVWTRDSVNLDSSTEESRLTLVGARKLPTDSEIDQRVDADLAGLEARALSKTGLESSDVVAEPVVVTGLHLENIGDAAFHIKLGKDDLIRFTPLGVTIINFTQHQLVAYQCTFDLITGNPRNESTDEYFYQDVVSVSTQSQSKNWYLDRSSKRQLKNSPLEKIIRDDSIQFNAAETFI